MAIGAATSLALAIAPVFVVGALGGHVRDDLGLSRSQLGLLVSALMVVALAAAPLAGRAVDRVGERPVRRLGLAAALACHSGIGLWGTDGLRLALGMAVGGVGLALVDAATNAQVGRRVPREHQAMSFGLKELAAPLATLVGGLAAAATTDGDSWRWVFLAMAGATSVWLLVDLRSTRTVVAQQAASTEVVADTPMWRAALLAVGLGLGVACATCLTTYVVEYSGSTEVGAQGAGRLLAAASVGVILVRLVTAYAVSRNERIAPALVCLLVVSGAAGHFLLPVGSGVAVTAGVLLGLVFGYGWGAPVFLLLARRYPSGLGRAAGVVFMGGYAGAVLGPPLFGLVADGGGFELAWLCSGTAALLAAVAIAFGLASPHRERVGEPPATH